MNASVDNPMKDARQAIWTCLNQPAFFQDPYPCYAELRATGRAAWLPHEQESASKGVWLFSRHADAEALFREYTAVSKNIRAVRPPGMSTPFDLHVLHRDGADHLRLRRLVSDFFSIRYLNQMESRMEQVADALVNDIKAKGTFDLIPDFAEQMPLRVIAELIGVPVQDMPLVRKWSIALGDGFDSLLMSQPVIERQKQALAAFLVYAHDAIKARHQRPDGSLLSHIAAAEGNGLVSDDESIAMVGFLLFSGHETTINLIGNGLWLLLSHPEQWQLLVREPERLPDAIEEILRYESPEQRTSFRLATDPLNINGIKIEPGQQLGIIIGSANRDDAVFTNPDVFDIRRDAQRHLAFGLGLHNCLGKTLARMEARIALGRIIAQLPGLTLSDTSPSWRHNSFFRGLSSLNAHLAGL